MLDDITVNGIAGYVPCRLCRAQVLEHVAYQTRGVCFDCFLANDMEQFREVEISLRATRHKVKLPPANTPPSKRKSGKTREKKTYERVTAADLARLRACRRMAGLFPEVFAIVYAEERWKAGLAPKPSRVKDLLADAVETFVAFSSYYQTLERSGHGEEAEMVSDSGD